MIKKLVLFLSLCSFLLFLTACQSPLKVTDTSQSIAKALDHTGSVQLEITGGKKPYSIKWLDGSTQAERTGLAAGRYIITVSDAREDKIVHEVVIEEPRTGTLISQSGTEYQIVKIGDQWWMAENFRDMRAADGTALEGIAYPDKSPELGLLYDYQSALLGAPDGWHLATDMDFMRMEYLFGMTEVDAESYNDHERGTYQGLVLHPEGESGFEGHFYGYYDGELEEFMGFGESVTYWSDGSPEEYPDLLFIRTLTKSRDDIGKFAVDTKGKYYVRYVYGKPAKSID